MLLASNLTVYQTVHMVNLLFSTIRRSYTKCLWRGLRICGSSRVI